MTLTPDVIKHIHLRRIWIVSLVVQILFVLANQYVTQIQHVGMLVVLMVVGVALLYMQQQTVIPVRHAVQVAKVVLVKV